MSHLFGMLNTAGKTRGRRKALRDKATIQEAIARKNAREERLKRGEAMPKGKFNDNNVHAHVLSLQIMKDTGCTRRSAVDIACRKIKGANYNTVSGGKRRLGDLAIKMGLLNDA